MGTLSHGNPLQAAQEGSYDIRDASVIAITCITRKKLYGTYELSRNGR